MYKEFLIIYFGGAILTYILGKSSRFLKVFLTLVVALAGFIIFTHLYGANLGVEIGLFKGFNIGFGIDHLSWIFGEIAVTLGLLLSIGLFSFDELPPTFFFLFQIVIGSMVLIVMSRDLVSFFFFWETMTWSSFFTIFFGEWEGKGKAAVKYFLWSLIGAYSILLAFSLLYSFSAHSLLFKDILLFLPGMSTTTLIAVFTLLVIGFGVKTAVMPLHVWAPPAYRESPHPFTPIFSGVLSKMGIYGIFLSLFFFTARFSSIGLGYLRETHILGYILAWFGGATAFLGALIAIKQDSAKKLLAYSSISQLGYVIFGLGIGTSMAVTGALFHAISHAIFKGLLFLAIAGVIKRIGTDDLTEMGGLIKKMPFTFVFSLLGILALAGIPPTIGFPSKWLLYEAAIERHFVFLAAVLFIASTTAFLYSYKFLFSIFLGQLHEEHKEVKEAPTPLLIGEGILSLAIVVFGLFPGVVIDAVTKAMAVYKIPSIVAYSLTTVTTSLGSFNALVVGILFLIAFLFGFVLYLVGGRAEKVEHLDNYLAGEAVESIEMHYGNSFYQFLIRELSIIYTKSADEVYRWVIDFTNYTSEGIRKLFLGDGQVYLFYMAIFLFFMVFIMGVM